MAAAPRPSQQQPSQIQKYARAEGTGYTLPDLLAKFPQKIALAIPKYLDAERMLRIALTTFYRTPGLWDCEPMSVAGAVVQCAQLGLEPDGVLGLAYLVPFKNTKAGGRKECQMLVGYKGFVHLGRRSGEVKTVSSEMVYEGDDFRFGEGSSPYIEHVPYVMRRSANGLKWEIVPPEQRGDTVAAYSVISLRDGGHQQKVMGIPEIYGIRDRSSAAYESNPNSGPWVEYEDWMIKKTTIRQLYKLAPLSDGIRVATGLEDRADAGLSQELTGLIEDITGDRPANPRGPVPAPEAAPPANGKPEGSNGPQAGAGAPPPAQERETTAKQTAPVPVVDDFDDPEFGRPPEGTGEPGPRQTPTQPKLTPLTVNEFSADELRQVSFNLKTARIALNRAQLDSWLAQRFQTGQKNEALAEAARIAK